MALYTSSYLKNLRREKSFTFESRMFSESQKVHTSFDIFLSHSFLDKDEVEGLYQELTSKGFSVYVDWIIDPQLDRKNVTKQTAELIRSRLKMSKTLLLAISTNATLSKWMPWELGYVDGNTHQCAIVPIATDGTSPKQFTRAEYLLLYPYIKKANISNREDVFVTESANNHITLNKWVRENSNPVYNNINIDQL